MRIPFDRFALSAAVAEISAMLPARVQDIRQPDADQFTFELFGSRGAFLLLVSVHSQLFRAHIATRKPANAPSPLQFCSALRSKLAGASMVVAEQVNEDRVLSLSFESELGDFVLLVELFGNRSNAFLLNSKAQVVAIAQPGAKSLASRQLGMWKPYVLPAKSAGVQDSKFFQRLVAQNLDAMARGPAVFVKGAGAYPVQLESLGLDGEKHPSFGRALELAYVEYAHQLERDRIVAALRAQVSRVVSSNEQAIRAIDEALAAASSSKSTQIQAELLLAYGPSSQSGTNTIDAFDYDGNPIKIQLDEDKDYKETAVRLFAKAKKAKERAPLIVAQRLRLAAEQAELLAVLTQVDVAPDLNTLRSLEELCAKAKWWRRSTVQQAAVAEAHGGKKIRELIGPGGSRILYGENAEANDFLTGRIGKPDDYWFHVRGHTSTHVLLPTQRHPERIPMADIHYAALIATLNSGQKHASHVPVDYTLKKYVRKPRGAAAGTAHYTNEKTIFIDPDRAKL